MNKVYTVWSKSDDTESLLLGIATTKEKANEMTEKLYEVFENSFEYVICSMELDKLNINDEEVGF